MKNQHGNTTRRAALGLLAGGAGLTLSGCGSVFQIAAGEPPRLYRLSSKSTFPDNIPSVDWQLVVDTPAAPASVNTNRIGLMETSFRFNYFALANWVDRAPVMVQNLIIESFDNSDAIVGVGPASIGLRPNFVLQPELREFQAHHVGNEHEISVVINARLVQMPERKIVAVEQFGRTMKAPTEILDPVIQAFDDALGKVLKRLVVWTLEEGDKAWKEQLAGQTRSKPVRSRRKSTGTSKPAAAPTTRPIRRLTRPTTAG